MKKGVAALTFLVLGALYVPSWPIQLVCYFGIAVFAFSLLYSSVARRALAIERHSTELRAYSHAVLEVGLEVRNRSFLPFACVGLRDRHGSLWALSPPEAVVGLGPRGVARLHYTLKTAGRGVHEIGPVTVCSADPLGLFPWERTVDSRCRVTVFPVIGSIRPRVLSGSAGGEIRVRSPAYEDPTRFRGVREYVPGDDTRRIDWKTSARLGDLYTVEYESALSAPCLVLLDLRSDRYPLRLRHHLMERAIETAATLIVRAASARQPTGLYLSTRGDGPAASGLGRGMPHAVHLLDLLARALPGDEAEGPLEAAVAARFRAAPGTRACFVGPPPEPEALERARDALRGTRVEVYRVGGGPADIPAPGTRSFLIQDYGEELVRG